MAVLSLIVTFSSFFQLKLFKKQELKTQNRLIALEKTYKLVFLKKLLAQRLTE